MRPPHLLLLLIPAALAYDRCRVLDCAQNARVSWTINYAGGYIEAQMQAKGMGYVALGIAPGAVMSGDIIVGWVPSMMAPGAGLVRDYSASTRAAPRLDAQQDVQFIASSMLMDAGGLTSITWRRALNTSDAADAVITPGRVQNVMWASNPNAGAVVAPDGSSLQRHLSNTRGIVGIDFGAPSSCLDVCGPSGPRRIDVVRSQQCLGNGWTPAEAAGDRDGGAARPRVLVTRSRNATRLVAVNVTASPASTGSATPTPSGTPTQTGSTGASASGTPVATPAGSASGTPGASPSASASVAASPAPAPSPVYPDAVAAPLYTSADGVSFRAAWRPAPVRLPNGSTVPGMRFQLALGPGVGYGALGFSRDSATAGMRDADMLIAWARVRGGSGGGACAGLTACDAFVGDYTSGSYGAPSLDSAVGGASDVQLEDASVSAGGLLTRVTFSRPLVTGDVSASRDADLSPARAHGMMFAVGTAPGDAASGGVAQHTAASLTAATYDVHALAASGVPVVAGAPGAARARLIALHASAMVLAFWLAMALGVALARYRSLSGWLVGAAAGKPLAAPAPPAQRGCCGALHAKPRWYMAHVYLQLGALGAAAVGWAAVLAVAVPAGRAFNAGGSWGLHERVGISALALALVQGLVGGALRPAPDSPRRHAWLVGHRLVGGLTLLLGSAALFSGLRRHTALGVGLGALHVACYAAWTLACEVLLARAPATAPSSSSGCTARRRAPPITQSPGVHYADVAHAEPLDAAPVSGGDRLTQLVRHAHAAAARGVLPPLQQHAGPGRDGSSGGDVAPSKQEEQTRHCSPAAAPASDAAARMPPAPASVLGQRLLVGGLGVSLATASALVAVLAASANLAVSPPGGRDADDRRLRAAPLSPPVAARALFETVWVNESYVETYNESVPIEAYPGGERDLCFFMTNYTVPAVETSYVCRGFALPRNVSLHALEFEFLADRSDLTHHMVAYTSWLDPTRPADWGLTDLGGGVWDCGSGTPNVMGAAYVWAVGQDRVVLPPGVGLRVGVAPGVAPASFAVGMEGIPFIYFQMHYNNPSRTVGLRDSSGFRMRVTTALRPIEAGLLWIGAEVNGPVIPANRDWYGLQADFTVPPLPPASAVNPRTSAFTLFSVFLHGHLITRKIWVETLRGGVPLRAPDGKHAAGQNTAYNFEIQAYEPINSTFAAGDVLRTRCAYTNTPAWGALVGNTRAAAGLPVNGGESTADEMCMAFLLYYPRIPNAATIFMTNGAGFCEDGPGATLPSCVGLPS